MAGIASSPSKSSPRWARSPPSSARPTRASRCAISPDLPPPPCPSLAFSRLLSHLLGEAHAHFQGVEDAHRFIYFNRLNLVLKSSIRAMRAGLTVRIRTAMQTRPLRVHAASTPHARAHLQAHAQAHHHVYKHTTTCASYACKLRARAWALALTRTRPSPTDAGAARVAHGAKAPPQPSACRPDKRGARRA